MKTAESASDTAAEARANAEAEARAEMADLRRRAAEGGAAVPLGCVPTRELPGNVVLLGPGGPTTLGGGGPARHVAVVCDRSDSMLGVTCDAKALAVAYDAWLERTGAAVGSSFAVYGVA